MFVNCACFSKLYIFCNNHYKKKKQTKNATLKEHLLYIFFFMTVFQFFSFSVFSFQFPVDRYYL